MGEFVTIKGNYNKNKDGVQNQSPQSVYLQFIPGIVLDVCLNNQSPTYIEPRDINSIIAKKHFGENSQQKSMVRTRYYPLFRGMVDVPLKGDPVLLCEIGGVKYYLGPLNTLNSPNFNVDTISASEPSNSNTNANKKSSNKAKFNIPRNYMIAPIPRLQKIFKPTLDDPKQKNRGEEGSIQKIDTHGDMLFEGRYGNSIRIGSRGAYPLMLISNGRNPQGGHLENSYDGSLISMTSAGSILKHFKQFVLASDSVEENQRLIAGGNDSEETEKFNYNYGEDDEGKPLLNNQILINSDKVTINARKNNLTLSSLVNLDIGSGNNLTINTKNYTSIESSNIYLGKQAKQKRDDGEQPEPLVLGIKLKELLEEMVSIIETLKVTACIAGLSGPIDPITVQKITSMKNKLSSPEFWSEYHFIEDNGQKTE